MRWRLSVESISLRSLTAMHEVEIKLSVDRHAGQTLLRRFEDILSASFWEKDTYFTSPARDLIASEECLRVRRRDGFAEITWKPPTSPEMRSAGQYWKEEINVLVDFPGDGAIALLTALGFEEYVTVSKERRCARIDDATTLIIDVIENVGWFIEIETMSDSPEEARRKNERLIGALGLDGFSRAAKPYRDIVKDLELGQSDPSG